VPCTSCRCESLLQVLLAVVADANQYRMSQLSSMEQPAVAQASSQLREKSSRNRPKNLRGYALSNRPDQPITNAIRSQLVPKQSEVVPTGTAPSERRTPAQDWRHRASRRVR